MRLAELTWWTHFSDGGLQGKDNTQGWAGMVVVTKVNAGEGCSGAIWCAVAEWLVHEKPRSWGIPCLFDPRGWRLLQARVLPTVTTRLLTEHHLISGQLDTSLSSCDRAAVDV